MAEKVQGFSSNSVQLLIEGVPTSVLKLNDTASNVNKIFFSSFYYFSKIQNIMNKKKIQSVISSSFGIRCPSSLVTYPTTSTFMVFDYESSCQWDNMPANSQAFCGKCALKNTAQLFSNTANSSLTFNNVRIGFSFKL